MIEKQKRESEIRAMIEKFSLKELKEKFNELLLDIDNLKENKDITPHQMKERAQEIELIFDLVFARMMMLETNDIVTNISNSLEKIIKSE